MKLPNIFQLFLNYFFEYKWVMAIKIIGFFFSVFSEMKKRVT